MYQFCTMEIEDLTHILAICPQYDTPRNKYLTIRSLNPHDACLIFNYINEGNAYIIYFL